MGRSRRSITAASCCAIFISTNFALKTKNKKEKREKNFVEECVFCDADMIFDWSQNNWGYDRKNDKPIQSYIAEINALFCMTFISFPIEKKKRS